MKGFNMLKRKTWLPLVVGFACLMVALVAIFLWPYDIRELEGDATIDDTGFWSYPRYHVRFPAVSLSEPGEHVFTVSGLPSVQLTFILNLADLQNKEEESREFLRTHPNEKFEIHHETPDQWRTIHERFQKIDTIVEFTWSSKGEIMVAGAGPLKSWKLSWVPAYDSGGYWHSKGRELNFRRNKVYQLKLKVTNVDVHAPPLLVVPTLEGGGFET
jgi:hypothetical protein